MLAMGMWSSRIPLVLLGVAGALWASAVLPSFSRSLPASAVVERIVADNRFKSGALSNVLHELEAGGTEIIPQPDVVRARALVRLRLAEEVMARQSSEAADREVAAVETNVRSTLSLNPGDSLLWLMLYSVVITRTGFDPHAIVYLDQSYSAGPYEGWISIRRNSLALAIFSLLPKATQDAVVSEFAEMTDSDFIETVVTNLTGVGWPNRSRLLEALSGIDIVSKRTLYKRLSIDGIKVSIPGLEIDERPWR